MLIRYFATQVFQFPFIIYGLIGFLRKDENVRVPALCYAVHVLTTMIPIIAELLIGKETPAPPLTIAVYGVWVFFPLLMLWRCSQSPLFPASPKSGSKKGQ